LNILILNGPNLNLLGKRVKQLYGNLSLRSIKLKLENEFPKNIFTFFQSNIEGELIDKIQTSAEDYDALIINPGGYAHTSVAIKDALAELTIPKIEVHLSHLAKREDYRQTLLTASACDGYISGFKDRSYSAAVYLLEKENYKS
jgi:3-dehydroquinate dehydratase-2